MPGQVLWRGSDRDGGLVDDLECSRAISAAHSSLGVCRAAGGRALGGAGRTMPTLDHLSMGSTRMPRPWSACCRSLRRERSVLVRMVTGRSTSLASRNSTVCEGENSPRNFSIRYGR